MNIFDLNFLLINKGFYIKNFEIRYYGIIIACAMLIAVLMARILAKKRGLNPDSILTVALLALPLAILGARIYYCIFTSGYTFKTFWDIRGGGLAIYGGIIGGILGCVIYCLIKKDLSLLLVLFDIIVPVLIFAQALGRWGNFFNQEAYGKLITNKNLQWFPFGVFIDDVQKWHLATFFYEFMWNLIGFAILTIIFYRSKITGTTTASYLIYYGIGRFWIEGLRTDSLYLWNSSIRVSQALSLVLILVGISILIFNYIKKKNKS